MLLYQHYYLYTDKLYKNTVNFIHLRLFVIFLIILVVAGFQKHIKFALQLTDEVTISAYLLAFTIPVQSMSAMFRGINEAFENFKEISFIRMWLGAANFLGPFCVALVTKNLSCLVASLFVSRLIAFYLFRKFAYSCLNLHSIYNTENVSIKVSGDVLKQLVSFGGWFTLSSLISPIFGQADRFLIGSIISATAVAAYTIPFEVVTQSLIFVGAISSVAFPFLSNLIHSDPRKANQIFKLWLFRTILIMFIITTLLFFLLPLILPWWIGKNLPSDSIQVGQILCVGVFFNAIGAMYYAYLHARGRSDITAKFHLIELPFFILSLIILLKSFGIVGAALAWSGRILIDSMLLFFAHRQCSKILKNAL